VSPVAAATLLLLGSNVFMTFAWYAHCLWAALCSLGAVYFMFRSPGAP